ncbi:MAG: hypothetical protein RMA76_29140 [Deltaproteobacteria bacterium]
MHGFDNPLLAALADRRVVDVSSFAAALAPSSTGPFETLRSLAGALPTGFVHAERVYVMEAPPPELRPLAPDSPWYAEERSLVVAMGRASFSLEGLLERIGRYGQVARAVHDRLAAHPELVQALASGSLGALDVTQLAMSLDASPAAFASVESKAPELFGDLAAMAQRVFDPEVHVHADLTPVGQTSRGEAIAEAMLGRAAPGTFKLLVSDHAATIELLSPYTRDLGHALYQWSLENPEQIFTRGLVEAIRETPEAPEDDLAALIVPDLLRVAPQLLEERRVQESTAGLWLQDVFGTAHGVTDVATLADPDPVVFSKSRSGSLLLLAGGSPTVLLAASRALFGCGRVSGFAGVFGAGLDDDRVVIPSALVAEDDGVRFSTTQELTSVAEAHDLSVTNAGPIPVGHDRGASTVALRICEAIRRARILGSLEADASVYLVLHPRSGGGLRRARCVLRASRLALLALLGERSQKGSPKRKSPKSEGSGRLSRRFRA